jgi:guanylate kinase
MAQNQTKPSECAADARGVLIVLSGPSGVGKTTVYRRFMEIRPSVRFSVSCTTRQPRTGEADGTDYHFLDRSDFQRRVGAGEFLEHAEVHGNLYGTLRSEVEDHLFEGQDVLLDIDVQGARLVRESARGTGLERELVFVFIGPPSLPTIEQRLRSRATDSDEVIERRLENAKHELAAWQEYEYLIINDEVEQAAAQLVAIRDAARCATVRCGAPWTHG